MDILVFSDSHGEIERMRATISRLRPDAVLHLGDGVREFETLAAEDSSRRIYLAVHGNCDRGGIEEPKERLFTWEGLRILALHGYTKGVKHGTEALERYAREQQADIVLYWHTHRKEDLYLPGAEGEKGLRLFNPGSIGDPFHPSFGVLHIKNGQVVSSCSDFDFT